MFFFSSWGWKAFFFPAIFNTRAQIYAVSLKVIKTIIIICHDNHTIIFHQTSVTTVNVIIGYSANVLHCLMTLHNYNFLLLQQWQQQPQRQFGAYYDYHGTFL